ncbi:MAG: molybdenum cofactor guanylyltransferase [Candidatus Aminicenantes bacterium]|nr:molybdenum cofactor guanylyltransferase [Candidatus Aminicenantes bacterium]
MKKQKNTSAIILAGGKGTRINGNKALLPVSGITIIEKIVNDIEPYFEEILISAQSRESFNFLPHRIVVDEELNTGPLMGILSGLRASKNAVNFVIACDIPEVNFDFLEKLNSYTDEYDIVVPVSGKNKFEPLFAFYNKNLIPKIEELLIQKQKKISKLFLKCKTKYIPMENNGWYYNLNFMENYKKYLKNMNKNQV